MDKPNNYDSVEGLMEMAARIKKSLGALSVPTVLDQDEAELVMSAQASSYAAAVWYLRSVGMVDAATVLLNSVCQEKAGDDETVN